MDDENTARSGFDDQDLRGVSKLNVPLRDHIDWFDPEGGRCINLARGEVYSRLPDFTLQQLQESALPAARSICTTVSNLGLQSLDPVDGFNRGDADVKIWVNGEDYKLPEFTLQQLRESSMLAVKYMEILYGTTVFQNKSGGEISSHLSELIVSFSRSAAEATALNDAVNYERDP